MLYPEDVEKSTLKACFALILRKTIVKLRRISTPVKPTAEKAKSSSLLEQVQNYNKSGNNVMGVGQIGDGVKVGLEVHTPKCFKNMSH